MRILTETPVAVVRALAAKLPRLQAEEALLTVQAVALGSGTLTKDIAGQIMTALIKVAGVQTAPARKASAEDLGGMGIGVRRVASGGPA